MKIRIKFAKSGSMKFIGHLDVMRFFQKVMRRADVDICYSGGFSPHQIMSFASPLGLGVTSEGEYLDIEVNSTGTSKDMIERMNRATVEGIEILSYRKLEDSAKNAMSIVAAADYRLCFREGYEPDDLERFFEKLEAFLQQKEIVILKKTKKSQREVDIRPMVYSFAIKDYGIYMQVATGSVQNLKPELVLQAFYEAEGMLWDELTFQVHRIQTYAAKDVPEDGTVPRLIPLEDLGEEIE